MDAPTPLHIGTEEHYRWLHWIVKSVLVLNLADAVFTLIWIRWGLAHEANALMRDLVIGHAMAFMAVKLGLVSAGSWLLWRWRHRPVAVIAVFVAFLAYYVVLLMHVEYASRLVRHLLS